MKNFFALLFSIVVLTISTAQAAVWTDITVVNPGAETGDTSGWTTAGLMSAVDSQWQSGITAYPHTGNWFFTAATGAANFGNLKQQISISSFASDINSGVALYDFGFWYQNEYWYNANRPDTAEGLIKFYDSSMNELFSYTTGEISSQDAWALSSNQNHIPIGATTVEISLWGYLHDGGAVNTHFDDISFKIGTPDIAPVPEPATLSLLGLGLLGLVLKKKKIA